MNFTMSCFPSSLSNTLSSVCWMKTPSSRSSRYLTVKNNQSRNITYMQHIISSYTQFKIQLIHPKIFHFPEFSPRFPRIFFEIIMLFVYSRSKSKSIKTVQLESSSQLNTKTNLWKNTHRKQKLTATYTCRNIATLVWGIILSGA